MPTYRLRVQLEAPLAVSEGRSADGRSRTPPSVPAPTLRGALAAHLERCGVPQDVLDQVFGEQGCRTTQLVPARSVENGAVASTGADADEAKGRVEGFPVPLTLNTCKRHGGFQGETRGGGESAHGAEDTLLATLQFAMQDVAEPLRALQQCDACGNVLVSMDGFARRTEEGYVSEPTPSKRTQIHVGRDRRRKGAESGVLYAREVLQESGSRLVLMEAEVTADDEAMEVLDEHIAAGAPDDSDAHSGTEATVLNVGTSISRGLGRCRVHQFDEADSRPPVRERVDTLNEAWQAAAGSEDAIVALTLRTPAFFVNDWLRPEMDPAGGDLLQAAREPTADHAEALAQLEKVHQVARPARLRAWNGLAGFPHATDQGLAAGSVLVYRVPTLNDALVNALTHVEQTGIGVRRELGFGRVVACDPIHAEVHEHTGSPV